METLRKGIDRITEYSLSKFTKSELGRLYQLWQTNTKAFGAELWAILKEADASVTESDFNSAASVVQQYFTQASSRDSSVASATDSTIPKQRIDVLLSQIRQPKGGTENLTNTSTPGLPPAKFTARPAEAGYGRQGKTIPNVENINYKPGEFSPSAYDSGFTSRVRNPNPFLETEQDRGSYASSQQYDERAKLNPGRTEQKPEDASSMISQYKAGRALQVLKEVERRNKEESMESGRSFVPMYSDDYRGEDDGRRELLREDEELHERLAQVGTRRDDDAEERREDEEDEAIANISDKLEDEAKEADDEARRLEMKGNWEGRDSFRNRAIALRSKAAKVRARKNKVNLPF